MPRFISYTKRKFPHQAIIYLAGIIDGEGCVKPLYNHARCEISNTSKELIDWIFRVFGGHCCPIKREGNRKLQYRILFRKAEIKNIIPLVLPYLIVKKEEAKKTLNLARKKYINPFKGKKHTEKSKRKMSKSIKKLWTNSNYRKNRKIMFNLKKY